MDYEDLNRIRAIDSANLLSLLDRLPQDLSMGWQRPLDNFKPPASPDQIIIYAVGEAAVAAELAAAYLWPLSPLPIRVAPSCDLPEHLSPQSLIIAAQDLHASAEVRSVYDKAVKQALPSLAIAPEGSDLAQQAEDHHQPLWTFQAESSSISQQVSSILRAITVTLPDLPLDEQIDEAVKVLQAEQAAIRAENLNAARNPAKRLAGQLMWRVPIIWGSGLLGPVAAYWKMQINRMAKTRAYAEDLADLHYGGLNAIGQPNDLFDSHRFQIIHLSCSHDSPAIAQRQRRATRLYREQGMIVDRTKAAGEGRLAQQMSLVQIGAYVAFYLAIAYAVNPLDAPITDLLATLE
ncbi:MAG: hypothetical protein GYB68_19195 [Chloroflexi bacterium]|nr:hypothetical protein [Chloroflexota bacterium]